MSPPMPTEEDLEDGLVASQTDPDHIANELVSAAQLAEIKAYQDIMPAVSGSPFGDEVAADASVLLGEVDAEKEVLVESFWAAHGC